MSGSWSEEEKMVRGGKASKGRGGRGSWAWGTKLEGPAEPLGWWGSLGSRAAWAAGRAQTREGTCSKSHREFVAKPGLEPRP